MRSFTPQQLNCRKFNWKTADWKTSLISSPASSEIRFISFEYLQYPHGISASLFSFLLQQASISCSVISLKLRSWFLQLRLSHYCFQFHFHLTTLFLIITAVVIIFINNLRSNRIKRHHFVSSKLYIHFLQAFCVLLSLITVKKFVHSTQHIRSNLSKVFVFGLHNGTNLQAAK